MDKLTFIERHILYHYYDINMFFGAGLYRITFYLNLDYVIISHHFYITNVLISSSILMSKVRIHFRFFKT
ncbi:hypothetical protein C1646_702668 [Rhizophagus diaphanus]|nr:hypothetical protein C1646_702668 [Rhizophagus diaphanus] [Rhizophagus sp. MUCL 43196]